MKIVKGYTDFVLQPLPSALGVSQKKPHNERDQTGFTFCPYQSTLACTNTQTLFWSVLHKACHYDNDFNVS